MVLHRYSIPKGMIHDEFYLVKDRTKTVSIDSWPQSLPWRNRIGKQEEMKPSENAQKAQKGIL